MPTYTFRCDLCDEERDEYLPVGKRDSARVICNALHQMRRVYKPPRLNWNGPPPGSTDLHPSVQNLIDTADERRAKFEKEHEAHEQRTANEE